MQKNQSFSVKCAQNPKEIVDQEEGVQREVRGMIRVLRNM